MEKIIVGNGMVSLQGLCETVLVVLIPFTTTWLRESGFSNLLSIKAKSRNHLNANAISNIVPSFKGLTSKKQEQKCH